jgi:hypothetical protein
MDPYNCMGDYNYHLAHYMLAAGCRSDNVGHFTKSTGIVATMVWNVISPHLRG